jgi:hypothetical protein
MSRKTKENPYGIAFLPLLGWGLLGGTAFTGAVVVHAAVTDPDFTLTGKKEADPEVLRTRTQRLLSDINGGFRPKTNDPTGYEQVSEAGGGFTSSVVCPPSVKSAYSQAAYWYAVAAFIDNGNTQLMNRSRAYLKDAKGISESITDKSRIISVLEGAANGLSGTGDKRFQPILNILLQLTSGSCIERAKQHAEDYSPTGNLKWAVRETVEDIATPITVITKIFTSDEGLYTSIRWGMMILAGTYVYNTIKGD